MLRYYPCNYQQWRTVSTAGISLNKTYRMWIKQTGPEFSFPFSTIHKHAMPGL